MNKHIKEDRPSFRPLPLLPVTEQRIVDERIIKLEKRIKELEYTIKVITLINEQVEKENDLLTAELKKWLTL